MLIEAPARKYTLEEFLELDLPEEEGPYELIGGLIVAKRPPKQPGPSGKHGDIITTFGHYLKVYALERQAGKAYSGSACFVGENYHIPDVCFISQDRVPSDPDATLPYPDIAIEVMSRSDKLFEVRDKVKAYLGAGTRLVWVVFYPDEIILEYRPNARKPNLLGFDDELNGSPVLPDFKLPMSKVFE